MTRPRQIPQPALDNAQALSALELNSLHFDRKHTLLTPKYLEKISAPSDSATGVKLT